MKYLSSQIHRDRRQISGCQGLEGGGTRDLLFNGHGVSVFQNEKCSEDTWW